MEECGFLSLKDKEASASRSATPGFVSICKRTFNPNMGPKLWAFEEEAAVQYLIEIEFILLQELVGCSRWKTCE